LIQRSDIDIFRKGEPFPAREGIHSGVESGRTPTSVSFPPFCLDYADECLWFEQKRIDLTPKAFAVLRHLVRAGGQLVTKEQLLNLVWPETFVSDAVLKVCVGEIRRALQDECKAPRYIKTLYRRGYRFIGRIQTSGKDIQPGRPTAKGAHVAALAISGKAVVPETHYARSGDVNIAYQVLGDGPLDLIFVMGWVSHLEYLWTEPSFARFLKRLASFSRVILLDKRGTGLSDRVPLSELPTLEQRMEDVRAVMEAVGSERAAICGVSEGGIMSALFAATYPSRTLALIMIGPYAKRIKDASYPWGPTLQEREEFYREILSNWGGPVGLEERAPSMANDPRFREWWATYLRMGASPGAALALTKMNTEIDAREVLKSVRVPTLVLHRTGDRCLSVEEGRYVASLIPHARFAALPGIDHLPFVGDQDSILDEVEDFLLGVRLPPESDHVLATVLFARFSETSAGPRHTAQPEARQFLSADLKHEIEWFRGRRVHVDQERTLALFDGPARAIRCACAIAERASWLGLSVAIGLHTGECSCVQNSPSGPAVQIAARVARAAEPGDIVVTGTIHDLVAGSGISLAERDALYVEELSARVRLFRVRRPCNGSASGRNLLERGDYL
jgi:pimeloyl-ACP methyl ester carboxylesterase/DNA-binding winged helix-turn-helix (wHTH) protein/class 3 adenylate cyclase